MWEESGVGCLYDPTALWGTEGPSYLSHVNSSPPSPWTTVVTPLPVHGTRVDWKGEGEGEYPSLPPFRNYDETTEEKSDQCF